MTPMIGILLVLIGSAVGAGPTAAIASRARYRYNGLPEWDRAAKPGTCGCSGAAADAVAVFPELPRTG